MKTRIALIAALLGAAPALAAPEKPAGPGSEAQPELQTYCSDPAYHELDFMIGDWLIYDHGQLMAISHWRKILRGCAILVEQQSVNDKYRRPGQDFRFASTEIYAYGNGVWQNLGTDNMGGTFPMRGERKAEGVMAFAGTEPRKGTYIKGTFELQADGSVLTTAFSAPSPAGEWKPMLQYQYRPNH